ncbi:hypothetical protein [Planctellipticum variicoloris]|uniref:hypothetical protein n=1 Tax=Planctellipticum variicoloris TaxID=3064265 RepID=UPI002C4DCD8C|nr:hypothetical protein SH412_004538 [Planctomycetaceae bacterium SH412]HTN02557.1 hypothetical protein [Planctomycetaceae bacterium]
MGRPGGRSLGGSGRRSAHGLRGGHTPTVRQPRAAQLVELLEDGVADQIGIIGHRLALNSITGLEVSARSTE